VLPLASWFAPRVPRRVVLFQASQELIEQIVELIGVIDKKRVIPGGWSIITGQYF
jgi:hypothetical protein